MHFSFIYTLTKYNLVSLLYKSGIRYVFIIWFSKSYFVLSALMNPSLFTLLYMQQWYMCVFVFIIGFSMSYFVLSTFMNPSLFTLLYSSGIYCVCIYYLVQYALFCCFFINDSKFIYPTIQQWYMCVFVFIIGFSMPYFLM